MILVYMAMIGLMVVQIAGKVIGQASGAVRDHFPGYPMGTIPCTLMHLVVALAEWFRLLSPRAGLSNRLQFYTFGFCGSLAARLTNLQFSRYYFFCLYVCMCGTNIFCRYLFAPWPYSPQGA